MIDRVIEASVRHRVFVLLVALVGAWAGLQMLAATPVDAIPDLSDVQVIVYTEYPGQSPGVVEDQVTYPLSTAMLSVPYARDVRAYSFFGFSLVYVIFEDGTDIYWARSRVLEYLNQVQGRLPPAASPRLGPDATGVGWIYTYALADFTPRAEVLRAKLDRNGDHRVDASELPVADDPHDASLYTVGLLTELLTVEVAPTKARSLEHWTETALHYLVASFDRDRDGRISEAELSRAANFRGIDLAELRSLQDWYLRYDLMGIDGVAEVATVGGFVRQYQVEVDPEKLRAYGVSLQAVKLAVQGANLEVGGRLIEMAETEFMVRGQGYLDSVEALETVPVGLDPAAHTPILLSQVATVRLGPAPRRGLADMNGEGEVVSGIVVMRFGGNARQVITDVKERLAELSLGLPEGVEVHTSYDRSGLIDNAVANLFRTLAEEMAVVAFMCVLILLHLRSALVPIIAIPLAVLLAFIPMYLMGVNANIMSLGGIALAIGVLDDASVVLVEDMHRTRERHPELSQLDLVIKSTKGLGGALFFSLLIVTASFLPVFTLEQQEGRLFGPLAYTKTFTMASASILAITVIPALMYYLVRGPIRPLSANPIARAFLATYRPVITGALRAPGLVVGLGLMAAVGTAWPLGQLGSEFMPPLNEGDLLYMPTTPPGISITEARTLLQQTDRIIATHPLVDHVLGKVGRADTATDPAPLSMIETTILLQPPELWPEGTTIESIVSDLDAMVQFPGLTNAWTMPIKTRIDMLATGIKTPVGIKLLGDDLAVLSEIGEQIEAVLQGVEGTASVYSERVVGGNYIDIKIRREAAARYGLNVQQINDVVSSAIGGMNVTETVEGLERYPVNIRFPRELRGDLAALREIAVHTPMGHTVPLGQVADIEVSKGPPAIKSENARRTAWIYVDLETDDIGGYVERAKSAVDAAVQLPAGVAPPVWSGQYEYMERANDRLAVVVPFTLAIIFGLLYAHFRRLGSAAMVMISTGIFAPVGGVWLMWWFGFNLSIAAAVGFIALAGLATELVVVMVAYLDEAVDRCAAEGRLTSTEALRDAIMEGAVDRVRPLVMTVGTTAVGLVPVMLGTASGSRVMKRLAAPMIGGLASAMVLALVLLPAIYLLWHGFWLRRELAGIGRFGAASVK